MKQVYFLLILLGMGVVGLGQTISPSGAATYCIGSSVTLTVNGATPGSTFQWKKDGGDVSTVNPYNASSNGNYTVIVTSNGNALTLGPIAVSSTPNPVIDFSFVNNTCSGISVPFTSSVTNGTAPYTYSWDFGDASPISSNVNPAHSFTSLGCGTASFTVRLTATDSKGCSATITKSINILRAPELNFEDLANFTDFNNCSNSPTASNPNFTVNVSPIATTSTCASSYDINWGDGNIQTGVTFPNAHTYTQVGAFNLVITANGTNGCKNTWTKVVANQSNPDIGIATFGPTEGCAPLTVSIIITTWQSNSLGTTYLLDYGDGTSTPFNHPINPLLTNDTNYHTYTTSSCPTSEGFPLKIVATNACRSKQFIGGDVIAKTKPQADFSISTNPACVNTSVCFTDQTTLGFYNGCSRSADYLWDFGDPSSSSNTSTQTNPCHVYTTAGTYTVKLTTSNPCGPTTISKTVCITQPPSPNFTLNNTTGCMPLVVNTTNTTNTFGSCQTSKYKWSVSYSASFCGTTSSFTYINNTTDSSANPSFNFANPGTYTITLTVTNACGSFPTTQTVTVKAPPKANIIIPQYSCGTVTTNLNSGATNCASGALTFAWTFTDASIAISSDENPIPITFTTVGNHPITLQVTNECGTTTDLDTVRVSTAPNVIVPPNQSFCGGVTTGALMFTSGSGSPNYNWTNSNTSIGLPSSGIGNIPSFTTINAGTLPVTATIMVTPNVSSCVGPPASFTITINPRPAPPVVVSPVTYCQNGTAPALTATPSNGNTLTWYTNPALTGGGSVGPVPSTGTAGSTTFYVTQTNAGNCASAAAQIVVTINAGISGNNITGNLTICANTSPGQLGSASVGGGGPLTYQWQSSTDNGVTWTNIADATGLNYTPPDLTVTTQYRRVVISPSCTDTSNVITIVVAGALTNFSIATNQTICAVLTPALLTGDLPSGGGGTAFTYIWQSSTDNINWNLAGGNTQDFQPPVLNVTTYYRRITASSACSATSNVVTITVNPTPTATITPVFSSICTYDAGSVLFSATAGTAPFSIELVVTHPNSTTDTIRQTINNNGPITIQVLPTNSAVGTHTIGLIKLTDNKSCERLNILPALSITVKPLPTLTLSPPATICNGVSTTLTASGADSYDWSPNLFINTTSGNSVIVNPPSTFTYIVHATLNGCSKDSFVRVDVVPGATVANAGPNQLLCNLTSTTLAANSPSGSATGAWSQLSGPAATITTAAQPNTTVTGLIPGSTYVFQWTITGQAPCPPTTSNVTINVLADIFNSIQRDSTICNGQTLTIQNNLLSGGGSTALPATYTFVWQSAPVAGTNWQTVTGSTNELIVSPTSGTCYRRIVTSNNQCADTSNTVCITVDPSLNNNNISGNQEVCVNVAVNNLIGSTPVGGNGSYTYNWLTSTDSITWVSVGTTINYQPPVYAVAGKHYFRRDVTSGNCTSASNVVTITIRPNAKAIFSTTNGVSCAPFALENVISVTALPDSNGTYNWYADGALFASNTTGVFPSYTIANPGDTVIIKLVTLNQFGCRPDSMDITFVTVATAVAKFTKDSASGCGPLTVNFTNTSNIINNNIQFLWDFGNGTTSNLANPGAVLFNTSPDFNDTTYYITLKAYNGCDTTTWRDSVKVRANPKARFGVVTTFGCSPFTVQISNTSLGGPNTYYWDFDNGHRDTTFTTGPLNYTYNTGNLIDTFTIRLIAVNECGRDTMTIDVRIAPNNIRPQITINATELFGCAPHTVFFNNATTGATTYTWNFDDGTAPLVTNNAQSSVSHTFNNAGVFNISIDISNGCTDTTVFRQVTVYPKPIAGFNTNGILFCAGDTVRTTNTSQNATNYQWFWGDGQSSTGVSPTHVYTTSGNYTILLRAQRTNNSGIVCFDTLVQSISVLTKPDVRIQTNITAALCAPFTFNGSAPNIINESVTWYITDTTVTPSLITLNGVGATYTFNNPGTFSIKMIAENAAGCKDSVTRTLTVRGTPVANFMPMNISICVRDTTISYINTSTFNDNGPLTYQWKVDNTTLATTGNFTHRYTVGPTAILPRIFTTKLIVTNTVGCTDTATATLSMNPKADAQFSIGNPNNCVPFVAQISNASTYATSYQWLLNGIPVDTSPTPSITITQSSTPYTISLIADNGYGCTPDTFSVSFTSRVKPNAIFSLVDTLGCTGRLNAVTVNTSTNTNTYTWDWGDGTPVSNFTNPTHLYNNTGQYLVTLVASDGTCRDTASHYVKVGLNPIVNFSANDTLTCDTAHISFTNLTTGAVSYTWNFGDGISSNDVDPYHDFAPSLNPYTITLNAFDAFGCKGTFIRPNYILAQQLPPGDFAILPRAVISIPDYTFTFNNLTPANTNYVFQWDLGDLTFANTRDVVHKYLDTGYYNVQLFTLDRSTNCIDTASKIVRIEGSPGYLHVPNAFYPNSIRNEFKTFKPLGKGLATYTFQVFDAWGKLLYQTDKLNADGSPMEAWDGRFKGVLMQQDAYVWKISAVFRSGKKWDGMSYHGETAQTFGTVTLLY